MARVSSAEMLPSTMPCRAWTRGRGGCSRWSPSLPYVLLAVLVLVTVIAKHGARGVPAIDLALCALAAAWMLWMFTLHPAWRDAAAADGGVLRRAGRAHGGPGGPGPLVRVLHACPATSTRSPSCAGRGGWPGSPRWRSWPATAQADGVAKDARSA